MTKKKEKRKDRIPEDPHWLYLHRRLTRLEIYVGVLIVLTGLGQLPAVAAHFGS